MKKEVSRKRIRVITDKIFEELWKIANDVEDQDEYISSILDSSSKYRFIYRKYDIEYEYYLDMLINIHTAAQLSIKDIINLSGMKKSSFGHLFCIPIRTIENWYNENRSCPSYIRLMFLRHFKLIKLGHYIYTESEVTIKKEVNKQNTTSSFNSNKTDDIQTISKETLFSIKEWEHEHLNNKDASTTELLEKLKYLDKALN